MFRCNSRRKGLIRFNRLRFVQTGRNVGFFFRWNATEAQLGLATGFAGEIERHFDFQFEHEFEFELAFDSEFRLEFDFELELKSFGILR